MTVFTSPLSYTDPDTVHLLKKQLHRHFYLLELRAGSVVAACECGAVLDAQEIENILNSQ